MINIIISYLLSGFFLSIQVIDREFFKTYFKDKPPGPQSFFNDYHFELVLRHISENTPIGRNKLASDLGLGTGSIRSIMKALKKFELIDSDQKGHSLTDLGKKVVENLEKKIPKISFEIDLPKEISIAEYNQVLFIKNVASKIKLGMDQTIAALKIDAKGALTIILRNDKFIIPNLYSDLSKEFPNFIEKIQNLFNLENNDVVVIGSGENKQQAIKGAWAAVYTLIE
ncbi:MAG: DUF4443 domain-containing protein [Candidatus Lokiarchaeota archaeon]|nr:DUF4443 domain-containing protein [Candidatus Lokiarchaeota archaeon]